MYTNRVEQILDPIWNVHNMGCVVVVEGDERKKRNRGKCSHGPVVRN